MSQTIPYRPAIDGLRAIAVIAVMLFHLSPHWLRGGFAGVDVFFVISGFLITSIIDAEIRNEKFSYVRFYQRRIARIFPLLFLVVAATLVASRYIYPGEDIAATGAAAFSAILSIANMKFMLQGDYFALQPDTQPLLHTWSLSVEEQFYLCFPPLLVWATWLLQSRRKVVAVLATLMAGSFVACVILTQVMRDFAFYLMPTRAWELLLGACLAISMNRIERSQRINWRHLNWLGWAILIGSLFLLPSADYFPGPAALAPVVATAILLAGERFASDQACIRWLRHPSMVTIGRLSYSLYLWHLPVYSMVDYRLIEAGVGTRTVLKLLLTVGLTLASYPLCERPARQILGKPQRRRLAYSIAIAGSFCLALISYRDWNAFYLDSSVSSANHGGIVINQSIDRPQVVLYGDSTGSMYAKTIADTARKHSFRFHVLSVAGAQPLPPSEFSQRAIGWIADERPDVLIVSVAWGNLSEADTAVRSLVREALDYSREVVVLLQPPIVPPIGSREALRSTGVIPVFEEPGHLKTRQRWERFFRSLEHGERLSIIDPSNLLTDDDGAIVLFDKTGRPLYQDHLHLSEFGSELVVRTLLTTQLLMATE